jgi:hypothetical protein
VTAAELKLLQAIADVTAVAFENIRLSSGFPAK